MVDLRHNLSQALAGIANEPDMLEAMSWLFIASGNGTVDEALPLVENRTREFLARDLLSPAGLLHGMEVFLYFRRLSVAKMMLRNLEKKERNSTTETLRHLLFDKGNEKHSMIEALYFLKYRRYDENLPLKAVAVSAIRALPLSTYHAVLDAACGTGLAGPILRDAGFVGRLIGIDVSSHMISQAREKRCYDDLEVTGVAEFLADCADTFEAILMLGIVPHLDPSSLPGIFRRTYELLGNDGCFLLDAPVAAPNPTTPQAFFSVHQSGAHIEQDLRETGFRIEAVEERASRTRQFLCRKNR